MSTGIFFSYMHLVEVEVSANNGREYFLTFSYLKIKYPTLQSSCIMRVNQSLYYMGVRTMIINITQLFTLAPALASFQIFYFYAIYKSRE